MSPLEDSVGHAPIGVTALCVGRAVGQPRACLGRGTARSGSGAVTAPSVGHSGTASRVSPLRPAGPWEARNRTDANRARNRVDGATSAKPPAAVPVSRGACGRGTPSAHAGGCRRDTCPHGGRRVGARVDTGKREATEQRHETRSPHAALCASPPEPGGPRTACESTQPFPNPGLGFLCSFLTKSGR